MTFSFTLNLLCDLHGLLDLSVSVHWFSYPLKMVPDTPHSSLLRVSEGEWGHVFHVDHSDL